MTLEHLSNLAQIVSTVAVIASLIYFAIQVRILAKQSRESTRLAQLTLQEYFTASQQEIMTRIAENPELYRIWRIGTTDEAAMSDEDRERFGFLLYSQMYRYYMQYQAQSLEPLEFNRGMVQIDRLARLPAFRSWWGRQQYGFAFDPTFVTLVNERIEAAMQRPSGRFS